MGGSEEQQQQQQQPVSPTGGTNAPLATGTPSTVPDTNNASSTTWKRHLVGVLVLLGTVVVWVMSSELIQFIYSGTDNDEFNSPFVLTYIDTGMFSLYLLGFLVFPSWVCGDIEKGHKSFATIVLEWLEQKGLVSRSLPEVPNTVNYTAEMSIRRGEPSFNETDLIAGPNDPPSEEAESSRTLTTWETFKVAAVFCPVWFIANYSFNLSLTMTSVASSTVISATSSLWTLLLGALLRVENFSLLKLLGVIVALGGVACVAVTDDASTELWGDFWSLIGAAFYAVYAVLLKLMVGDEGRVHGPMLLGFVGLINLMIMWPFGLLLAVTGMETFVMPSTTVMGYLLLNALIGTVLSDYLWLIAVLLTSPVVGTVGLTLTIPLSMVMDALLHSKTFPPLYIIGCFGVVVGFLTVNGTALVQAGRYIHRLLHSVLGGRSADLSISSSVND